MILISFIMSLLVVKLLLAIQHLKAKLCADGHYVENIRSPIGCSQIFIEA